jgi:hypothetical protein
MKLLLFPIVPCIRKNSALFQGFQASAACLYDRSSAKLMTSVKRGLSGTERGKKKPAFFGQTPFPLPLSALNFTLTGPGLKTRLRRERPESWGANLKNKIKSNCL